MFGTDKEIAGKKEEDEGVDEEEKEVEGSKSAAEIKSNYQDIIFK